MIPLQYSKLWLRVLAAPLLFLPAALALASNCNDRDIEALGWLERMARSSDEYSYHGVVTLQRQGEDMQVIQLSSAVDDATSSERMTQLTGQGAKVQRLGHPLHCVHPGHHLLRTGGEAVAGSDGSCGLAEFYRLRVSDGSRVAGRRAVQLEIMPRDMYRYGYVLQLDRATGLLLRSETLGRGKRVLEKFQFADLSFNERIGDSAEVSLVHNAEHPGAGVVEPGAAPSGLWLPRWLPRGFIATEEPGAGSSRRTYTDGMAVFSVFVEELDRAILPGDGLARAGSTTVYTRGKSLGDQPVLVTVVGEIPVNTARMVADSVSLAGADAD